MIHGVVYDCMLFLQAAANPLGPAGECFAKAQRHEVILYTSAAIYAEFERVFQYPKIRRKFTSLTEEVAADFLTRVKSYAIAFENVPSAFQLKRDQKDSMYIDLAIAAYAQLVVSRDNDLLDLMTGTDDDAILFRTTWPGISIVDPVSFLKQFPNTTTP